MSVPPRPQTGPVLSRRAAVAGLAGGVVGVLGLTGCEASRRRHDAGSGLSGGSAATGRGTDVGIVDRVTSDLSEVLGLVTAAGTEFGSLERRLRPFRELHRAHLAALSDTGGSSPSPSRPSLPRSPAAALRAVEERERVTRSRLADAAVAAESGALARLLASMSAGVAQQLAASSAGAGSGTPGSAAS